MNINEICNLVIELLEREGYPSRKIEVVKNGVELTGISIGEGDIVPTFYLNDIIRIGMSMDDIVKSFITSYEEAMKKIPDFDVSEFTNWDYAKSRLKLCLQRKTGKEEDIVKMDFLDMEMYVRVYIDNNSSYKINKNLLERFGITKEELFKRAIEQTEETVVVEDMLGLLKNIFKDEDFDLSLEKEMFPMLVISNKEKTNGAAAIYYKNKLSVIADGYGTDLIILPSSIHECLIIPYDESMNKDELNNMVKGVNATEVAEEEILSNHAYFFNRVTCELTNLE